MRLCSLVFLALALAACSPRPEPPAPLPTMEAVKMEAPGRWYLPVVANGTEPVPSSESS